MYNILKLLFPLLGMIKSASYPEKLTADQELNYLDKMAVGSKDAREKLIEHNLRLVAHIVKKFENTMESKEDLLSIGSIGLIKAVDTYRHPSPTKLATYAARCIENEILMQLRSNKKKRNVSLLNSPIGYDKEGNEILLIDIVADDAEPIEERFILDENIAKLKRALSILSDRELEILVRRYGLENNRPETQKNIAKDLGISRSYVSRIEKRALMKLYLQLLD
ncbi:RNA polymerase sporulation sigma factor SigK [Mycoplasmatota bacterium WC44]